MRIYHTIRSLFAGAVAAVVIAAGAAGGTATAQAAPPDQPSAGSSIWCGLWAGSSFQISDSCAASATGPSNPPSDPGPGNGSVPGRYAALGDSVAAGLGLPAGSYTTGADIQCGRSGQGYPNIVATGLHTQLINATCSGATAGDLVTKQRVDGPNIAAQLDTAFAGGTPELISITAGANDVKWGNFIRACYVADCSSGAYDRAAKAYMYVLQAKLEIAMSAIYARSNGTPPTIAITGYYSPLSTACLPGQQNITSAEITWLNNETATLNSTIQNVANKYSFVRYAPVSFSGHDVCAATPWVQGQNDAAPFHPTAEGQQAMARAVLAAFKQY